MCGIVGSLTFGNNSFQVTEGFIIKMRDSIAHRGPDGAGVWVSPDRRVGLGHRRLSIIDLSDAAAQPMTDDECKLQLVFNGEIYNHAEIRKELEGIGNFRWKTNHSDTEVILNAYKHWGIECIHRFRGMFAIGLWDEEKRCLWLIRDRMGVKPLYYSIHNGRLNFASEIKALLEDSQQVRKVNEQSLFHYLSFLTTPAPDTLFEGIKKLPNATWLRIDASGHVEQNRYWDVLDHTEELSSVSEADIAEKVIEELRVAVKLRKVSDVPVGVFLSGGIDSSTNAALFSEDATETVKTFSIGYEGSFGSYQNELEYAKLMADRVKAEYHEKLLTVDDMLDFLPRMIYLQDEPIADPVCFPVYYVSKLARENGVTVCQVGEGADELFWGYPGWKTSLNLQKLNDLPVPRLFKNFGLSVMKLLGKEQTFSYEWLRRGYLGQTIFWGGAEAFTDVQKKRLFSSRLKNKFSGTSSWEVIEPIRNDFLRKSKKPSTLNWMTYLDLNLRLPELLLMRVDKMSMGVSLEARVPFLDHKLVQLAMSLSEKIKTKNGQLKHILKIAVRGTIPDQIIERKKQGFGVPMHEWFLEKLGDRMRSELEDFCKRTDFFDYSEIQRLIEEKKAPQVWYLFNFALWWKEYIRD